jgi:hypothetical protein
MPSVNQPLDGSEKFAGLIPLALVAPEASEAGGGVKFENFGTLTFRHRDGVLVAALGAGSNRQWC